MAVTNDDADGQSKDQTDGRMNRATDRQTNDQTDGQTDILVLLFSSLGREWFPLVSDADN